MYFLETWGFPTASLIFVAISLRIACLQYKHVVTKRLLCPDGQSALKTLNITLDGLQPEFSLVNTSFMLDRFCLASEQSAELISPGIRRWSPALLKVPVVISILMQDQDAASVNALYCDISPCLFKFRRSLKNDDYWQAERHLNRLHDILAANLEPIPKEMDTFRKILVSDTGIFSGEPKDLEKLAEELVAVGG